MPFIRDWNPAYESKEAEADRELRRQALRQQQMQNMMSTVMQGVGMGINNKNTDDAREQQDRQFGAAHQQQYEQFMQDLNYRISTRDRGLAKDEAKDAASREMLQGLTGMVAPEGATSNMLDPMIRDRVSTNENLRQTREMGQIQIDQTPDLMRARAEAEFQTQTMKWGKFAEQTVKSLPGLTQMGVLKPEEADHLAQVLQNAPQSAIDVQKLIDHRMVTMFEEDWTKLQDMQFGQRLGAMAMDPGNMGGFTDEEKKRALFASKRIEAGLWGQDEAKLYTYTGSPFKAAGGTSSFERMMSGLVNQGAMSPEEAQGSALNRVRSQSMPPVMKDPEAIGETSTTVARLKAQVENFTARAKEETDPEKKKGYLDQATKLRERLGDAEGEAAKAKAGTKAGSKAAPASGAKSSKVEAAASAIDKFKKAHGRAPDTSNAADVAEMRSLMGM